MNRLVFYLLGIIPLSFIVIFSHSCANIGTISGGPKDSIPPEVVETEPVMFDTSFKENKVVIEFDEYVELKEINQEFVASPPFEEIPDFRFKKRSLHVKFKEPLKDSVTYTLNFGNAIVDYNESNILENYRFVFSTKSEIDSFSIAGNLKNAFDLAIPEVAFVMIFENNEDSIPFKSLPNYVCKIDTSGNFSIDYIKPGSYKIFGLIDINTNRIADEFEARAFLDSLIVPEIEAFTKIDSLKAGTILHDTEDPELSDSLENDTVIITNTYKKSPADLQLYLFEEEKTRQSILDYSRDERGKLKILFDLPVGPDFSMRPLNFNIAEENVIVEKNFKGDTITWWINDTTIMKIDSLDLGINYRTLDSLNVPYVKNDTFLFEYREKKETAAERKRRLKGDQQVEQKQYLKVDYLINDKKVDLNKNLKLEFPTPLLSVDTSRIRLFEIFDTTTVDTKEQKIVKAYRLKKDLLTFQFKRPIVDEFFLRPMNFTAENWYRTSASDSNRVYNCQITDQNVAVMDTLKLLVDFDNRFFFEQIQVLTDTAILPITSQKIIKRSRDKATEIKLVLEKPLQSELTLIPDDFAARGNWYNVRKNSTKDTVFINLLDKQVHDKDTLTFSVRCFDYFDINNDSVYFEETMRLTFSERKQYLVSSSRNKKDEFAVSFNKKMEKNPTVEVLNSTPGTSWYRFTKNNTGDTLSFKITDQTVSDLDTLNLVLKYSDTDRKGAVTNYTDTINLITLKRMDYRPRTKETGESTKTISKEETVHVYLPMNFNLSEDSIYIRRRIINSDWKEATKYLLRFDSLAFTDIYNVYNQAEEYEFESRELDFYTTLTLNLTNIRALQKQGFVSDSLSVDSMAMDSVTTDSIDAVKQTKKKRIIPQPEIDSLIGDGNIIVQLLGGKEDAVVREYLVSEDKEIVMDFLHPGEYKLKIIFDRNNNGKWDTGNYFKHIQPERVIMGGKPIQLESNIESVQEWNVGKTLIESFMAN